MKSLALWLVSTAFALSAATDDFITEASARHGEPGARAARFLVDHMPPADKESLTNEFLMENLSLALKARETFPWAKDVPEEIFLNDVLPYAVFDEPRDPWRAEFLEKAAPLVKDAKTASEAAQILNRDFFKLIKTHYNIGRKRPNQSPKESIELGMATCSGLSIILADACRAVGIPARAVGTPLWHDDSGNHTWVEIWDGAWHFTGADEYTAKGLGHGWFTDKAARADASDPAHSIYATSWKRDGGHFPLVWAPASQAVGGTNVTERYATKNPDAACTIGIRFFEGEQRIERDGTLIGESGDSIGTFRTKAGTADLNDMPRLTVKPGGKYRLTFAIRGETYQTATFSPEMNGANILDIREKDLLPAPTP